MRRLVLLLIATLGLHAQVAPPTEVQERRLANGARLLLVERRDLMAFHAVLVFRGGQAEEPTALAGATDLLARTLFGATWPEDVESQKSPELETLLKQEEGLLEALRLERLQAKRDPGMDSRVPALEAGLVTLQGRLKAQRSPSPLADLYLARGGRQGAEATADAITAWTELPLDAFEAWCHTESQRLRNLRLSRFSEVRSELATELRSRHEQGMTLLRGAALPGHPYGRDLADHLPALEALRWSELRSYARRALSPDRMLVILVGGIGMDTALPLIEKHLGSMPVAPGGDEPLLPEIPADLGDRRIQASLGGTPRLLVGWRIPPRSHPHHLALRMAAQLLGGGKASRLSVRLVKQKSLAQEVSLRLDVPGGRWPALLVADLRPTEGRDLAELDRSLQTEILRLQQEPIPQDEWQRALAQMETEHLQTTDEPAALASALGKSWVEGGDWRKFETEMQRIRTMEPESVQAAARTWLKPTHRTSAWLEAALSEGQNPLEAELARVLNALAITRIEDLAQRELLVSEGLRQLRMLSAEERAKTLKLLEAQLAPGKP